MALPALAAPLLGTAARTLGPNVAMGVVSNMFSGGGGKKSQPKTAAQSQQPFNPGQFRLNQGPV